MRKVYKKGGFTMAKKITSTKPLFGNKRSHSCRATKHKQNVNLQKVHMIVDGKPMTVKVSARALKTLKSKSAKAVNA